MAKQEERMGKDNGTENFTAALEEKQKSNNILNQRNKAKRELINKYNMSEEEAEETLQNIEKKVIKNKIKENTIEYENKAPQRPQKFNQNKINEHHRNQYQNNQRKIAEDGENKENLLVEKRLNAERIEIQKQKENSKIKPVKKEIKETEIQKEAKLIENINKKANQEEKSDDLSGFGDIFAKSNKSEQESKSNKKVDLKIKNENIYENTRIEEIIPEHTKNNEKNEIKKEKETTKRSVDELISDIIPYAQKEISIEVKNVSLSFEVTTEKIDNIKELFIRTLKRNKGNVTKFQALRNINFKIYKGEKIGIIGYNGAGKSTLLNVITGIYPPEEGEVKTYGRISPLLALGAGFDHNYSGRENIYLNGAIIGYSKEFLKSKYDEIVEFSELEEFIDFPVKNYSSGMLAKLGFSIATILEPDILIIDEVLGVGDVNFQKKSSDKIKSLMDAGTTVLLVSHSIPQIRQLCDKAIWIDKGEVREIGEVNEVCNHYLNDAKNATKDQLKDIRFK